MKYRVTRHKFTWSTNDDGCFDAEPLEGPGEEWVFVQFLPSDAAVFALWEAKGDREERIKTIASLRGQLNHAYGVAAGAAAELKAVNPDVASDRDAVYRVGIARSNLEGLLSFLDKSADFGFLP